jgi:beta-glucosidase
MLRIAALALCCAISLAAGAQSGPPSRVENLIRQMTLDEKLGQLVQRPGGRSKALNSKLDADELDRIRAGKVGSYLHVAGAATLGELQRLAIEESRMKIPLLFAMDVVHGYATIFPVPLAMASSWNPETLEKAARVAAVEATASGLHWTFAPMVDIARDPRWGRVVEGAGEDPYLGARMAAAQVTGYQDDNLGRSDTLLATIKHFGAYGAGQGGRDYDSADISERTLNEVYLVPFHAAVKAGSGSLMSAFNDIAGIPTTGNRDLLTTTLRDKWGFQGMVVSDWNAVAELSAHGVAADRPAAGALALNAGVDMDMVSGIYGDDLRGVVRQDSSKMAELDGAVRRVLTVKDALGLFDRPMQYHDAKREEKLLLSAEHRATARAVARQSMVLLKNDRKLLPLNPAGIRNLAVVGVLANDALSMLGSWRAIGEPESVVTILQGLKNAAPPGMKIVYSEGSSPRSDDRSGIGAAVRAVEQADATVLVIGEHFDLSGEARSRANIGLPASQLALAQRVIETGKPVVILLVNGRPLAMPWVVENTPSILETWMLGVEAGNAVADIVFGKVSPGGKLPITFPSATGQVPMYYAARSTGRPADADLTKDSTRYIDEPIPPLFAFGHGLSYSTFGYSDLKQSRQSIGTGDRIEISAVLTNTGNVEADEVVQLYVRDPIATVARPVQELRGFKRISLLPGKRKRVTFTLTPDQLAFYDSHGHWSIETGRIDFMIGASSADIRLRGAFDIAERGQGTAPAAAIATPVAVADVR